MVTSWGLRDKKSLVWKPDFSKGWRRLSPETIGESLISHLKWLEISYSSVVVNTSWPPALHGWIPGSLSERIFSVFFSHSDDWLAVILDGMFGWFHGITISPSKKRCWAGLRSRVCRRPVRRTDESIASRLNLIRNYQSELPLHWLSDNMHSHT